MLFKNKERMVYTIKKHTIALSRNDDKKRVQADCIAMLARGYLV